MSSRDEVKSGARGDHHIIIRSAASETSEQGVILPQSTVRSMKACCGRVISSGPETTQAKPHQVVWWDEGAAIELSTPDSKARELVVLRDTAILAAFDCDVAKAEGWDYPSLKPFRNMCSAMGVIE